MGKGRFDETWHRLREWTKGQAPSERLATQLILAEGYKEVDPSHPLGGRDGGKDATARREGTLYVLAVYFPRGQQSFRDIREKFKADTVGIAKNAAEGIVFVTNQELSLSERAELRDSVAPRRADILHLERITAILDQPAMSSVRKQFLDIDDRDEPQVGLGGLGGNAPGAGGGGGGVIGSGIGGRGGNGGNVVALDGGPGQFPGAGGGGAGVLGDGAIGGGGGEGGEIVHGTLDIPAGARIEIQVGKGGQGGGPGEDTILNVINSDGEVLRSVAARGGRPGEPGQSAPQSREVTASDVAAGFRLTSIIAAEYIRIQPSGLIVIVEGGWDNYRVTSNPFRMILPLLLEFDTGNVGPGTSLDVELRVLNPANFLVHSAMHRIGVFDAPVRRSRSAITLEFTGSMGGVWTVELASGPLRISTFPIEIIVP